MVKNFKNFLVKNSSLSVLAIIIFLFLFPLLIFPDQFIFKDNDLGRNYYPLFNFFKESVLKFHQLPLWRPDQMMGELVIGNPLLPVFYPLNVLFLVLPLSFAFFAFYFLHLFLAGLGTYYYARAKKLPEVSSFCAALFYALSLKLLLHTGAGHVTMVAAFSYFPVILLSFDKLCERFSVRWLVVGAVGLCFSYFNYPTVFYYSSIFLVLLLFYRLLLLRSLKRAYQVILSRTYVLTLLFLVWFGLSAVVFLPQLEFSELSTRSLLKIEDIALPLWNLKKFLLSITFPYLIFDELDHESLLYLGMVPSLLGLLAFTQFSKYKKALFLIAGAFTFVFVLNLSTPFFGYFYEYFPFVKYSRVTTRLWFIVAFVVAIWAAVVISKIRNTKLVALLVSIFIVESAFVFYLKLYETPKLSTDRLLYEHLGADKDNFRVYCTTYCFNPQLAQEYKLEMLNGETPIQDRRFVQFLEKAGSYNFGRFAVIFPPYQVWQKSEKPKPDVEVLSAANVKYVISTYELVDPNLLKVSMYGRYYFYLNKRVKDRVYFANSGEKIDIVYESPNTIVIKFPAKNFSREVIYAENYYPGWKVINGNTKRHVKVDNNNMRRFEVLPKTEEAVLQFDPESYSTGKTITFGTVVALAIFSLRVRKKGKLIK